MKKTLLLFSLLFLTFSSYSQGTCATAIDLTTNGTIVCPQITGTYIGNCAGAGQAATPNAIWYKYTPTVNGEVTVNSNIPVNPTSGDTRLSIITGTCAAPVCYNGNDDVSDTIYLSSLTFPVEAGITYYIVWDDRWSDVSFSFDFTFNAVSCLKPNESNINAETNITGNSVSLNWTSAIGNPSSYDIQYGVSGFTIGSGTNVNSTNLTTNLTSLTSGANYDYYIRSNCGATQSSWTGPFAFYLAKTLPFSNGFESPNFSDGFSSSTWSLGNAAGGAQTGTIYYFSNSSTTAATNSQLYSRALKLEAGEQVTTTFFTRLGIATGSNQTLKLYTNTTNSLTGATQIGSNITVSGATYTQQTSSFTAPTAGIYYLIFSNETPIVTTSTSLRLDTVSFSSVLSNNEFSESKFSIYPNPTSSILNISNPNNVEIKNISVVDINGRIVKNQSDSLSQINVSDLNAGVYFVTIEAAEGKTTKKFIKQ
jgi:hypothetical protein